MQGLYHQVPYVPLCSMIIYSHVFIIVHPFLPGAEEECIKGWTHPEQTNQISKCRKQIRPWPRGNELHLAHLAIGLWGKIVHRVVTLGMFRVLRQLWLVRMHLLHMLLSRCLRCLQLQLCDLGNLRDLRDLRWLPLLWHLLHVDRILRWRALRDLRDLRDLPLGQWRCQLWCRRCQATRAGRMQRMRSLGRHWTRTKPWARSMAQCMAWRHS